MPDPVWPRPSRSRPASASGMVAVWMGNGWVMPVRARASTSLGSRPRAAKPLSSVTSASTCFAALAARCSWYAASAASRSSSPWCSWTGAASRRRSCQPRSSRRRFSSQLRPS
ncbi:hypothetical protein [Ornithinimicrobium kibberense]|uniref:hypothetical protein n=1 Tax=Ornithinimicrobium kibberense TaxID=282060 RepID=UPI003615B6BE